MTMPQPGQKWIPLKDWKRFLRVADWFDRTHGHRPPSVGPPTRRDIHWGKLDAALTYDDTTGVVVSIWRGNPLADTGENIPGVLPPPSLTSGQLDEGDWVLIQWIDGRWRVVQSVSFGGNSEWGKLDGALAAGGTATVSIWRGGPAVSNLSDSGENVTAGAPPLLGSGSISSGDWVLIEKVGNYWWVVGAPC